MYDPSNKSIINHLGPVVSYVTSTFLCPIKLLVYLCNISQKNLLRSKQAVFTVRHKLILKSKVLAGLSSRSYFRLECFRLSCSRKYCCGKKLEMSGNYLSLLHTFSLHQSFIKTLTHSSESSFKMLYIIHVFI